MRVAVRKIDGVATVDVSLNQGRAVVRFRPDHRATVGEVREAIRRNGFTPKGADVRIRGQVTEQAGKLTLTAPGQPQRFALVGHPDASGIVGKTVVVEGTVPETARGAPIDTIEVRSWAIVSTP